MTSGFRNSLEYLGLREPSEVAAADVAVGIKRRNTKAKFYDAALSDFGESLCRIFLLLPGPVFVGKCTVASGGNGQDRTVDTDRACVTWDKPN